MTRNIYALLVGIDNYPEGVNPLQGCINDVVAVKEYLEARVKDGDFKLHLKTLKDKEATRKAIVNGFQQHLCKAGKDDVALFYYSGHGSQELAPPEFWHLEPERLDETLVCYDSRLEGGWDLADKEMAKLISEVSQKNPHVTVILDCCHSGSGSRDPMQETGVRRVPTDKRQRPINSFIFSETELRDLTAASVSPDKNPTGWNLPKGRHVLLAACRDNEEAKEYNGDGQKRGVFCYFLMETLKKASGNLTYRDLFKRTSAIVQSKVSAQAPQMEATIIGDLEQPFLGGAIAERTPYFTVSHHKEHGWIIDAGAAHGIPPKQGNETTRLALFPFNSESVQLRQLSQKLGEAEVTQVLPQLSKIEISGISDLSTETTFKAVVTALPLPAKGIRLEGDAEGIQLVRQALQAAQGENQPSLYVKEVTESEKVEWRVLARDGQYLIVRPVDDRPLVASIQNYTKENAAVVVKRLEHIARWTNLAELAPTSSRIPSDAIKMEIIQGDKVLLDPQIRLEYQKDATGKSKPPSFQVKLTNTSNERLYCALLDLTDRFAIDAGFFATGGIWLNPGEEIWASEKKPIRASIPDELWKQGTTEFKDILKLIVCNDEFDATLLQQGKLDLPSTRSVTATKGIQHKSTLNRLMNRVISRDLSGEPESDEVYDDWITSQVTITTVRPLDTTPVPKTGTSVPLASGVQLQAHPGLQANARLTTVTQSTRDLGNRIVPPILREDSEVTQPFQFTTSRGTDPGLSALELNDIDVETIKTVTPQQPLTLLVDVPLAKNERVLPIAYDGEYFIPLGIGHSKDGKTEIKLERLPEPVSEGRRSLQGSVRIFFQKVVSDKLSLEYLYPILAIADVGADEKVHYEADVEKVAQRVASSEKIVVFVHGIIGDTESIAPCINKAKVEVDGQTKSLAEIYDLALCFDYENLNTSIEDNARLLKQRLEYVGLGENHGKQLHIVAHSMGGLVSRWFIEREGGNKIVNHLIMLGTPNGGSPWSSVQDLAITGLTVALNSISTVAVPVKILGSLMAGIEVIDVSLDQMKPGSDFLKSLASSPDPGIPYTIIAGNTSMMPTTPVEKKSIQQVLQKLSSKAIALPFMGQENDIAVSVTSIKNVSLGRNPQPQVHEIGCDHLVYFNHPVGLAALSNAVMQALGQSYQPPTDTPVVDNTAQSNGNPGCIPGMGAKVIGGMLVVLGLTGLLVSQQFHQTQPNNQNRPTLSKNEQPAK